MEFIDAQDPKRIAKEHFIGEGKPHWHLKDCNILWLFQDKGRSAKGYAVSRAPKLWKHVTGFDIVVKILLEAWDSHKADGHELAFVDHLLSHIELTETDDYKIANPTVQEFIEVLNRHGAWREPITEITQLRSLSNRTSF